jgi:agmatine deiminase
MIPYSQEGNRILLISETDLPTESKAYVNCIIVDMSTKTVWRRLNMQLIYRDSQVPWIGIEKDKRDEVMNEVRETIGSMATKDIEYHLYHPDEDVLRKLIPDWEKPKSIVLVWPEGLSSETGKLKQLYRRFINLLCDHVKVDLYVNKSYNNYNQRFNNNVNVIKDKQVEDIWIRDFGPFYVSFLGKVKAVKSIYTPTYLKTNRELEGAEHNNVLGYLMAHGSKGELEDDINLVWDGGNIAYNAAGFAIITNRLISDNEGRSIENIKANLKEKLFLDDILFVPVEPGDDTGHVDGLIRFVDPDTVIIGQYQETYEDQNIYCDQITEMLRSARPKVKIHRLTNGYTNESRYGIASAVGNYLNFLRVGEVFFVPQYGGTYAQLDAGAIELFQKIAGDPQKVIAVEGCAVLAEYGGVLNCITKQIY